MAPVHCSAVSLLGGGWSIPTTYAAELFATYAHDAPVPTLPPKLASTNTSCDVTNTTSTNTTANTSCDVTNTNTNTSCDVTNTS